MARLINGYYETGTRLVHGHYESISVLAGFKVYWIPKQEVKAMKKNVAGQTVGVQLINSADGTPFTGAASVNITIDGGTQAAGTGTAPTHEGSG